MKRLFISIRHLVLLRRLLTSTNNKKMTRQEKKEAQKLWNKPCSKKPDKL